MRKILCLSLILGFVGGTAMGKGDGYTFSNDGTAAGTIIGFTGDDVVPSGDFEIDIIIVDPIDPLTASNGGWWTFRPWLPPNGTPGMSYGAHATGHPGINAIAGGVVDVDGAVWDNLITTGTGTIRINMTRVGDTITQSYAQPATAALVQVSQFPVDPLIAGTAADVGDFGMYYEVFDGPAGANTQGDWNVDRLEITYGGVTTTYEGASDLVPFVPPGVWGSHTVTAYAAVPATSSLSLDNPLDEPFTTGLAEFTLTFSEPVTGVAAGQFSVSVAGDGASTGGPTLTSGVDGDTVYTVEVTGVSGIAAVLSLTHNPGGAVLTPAGGEAVTSSPVATYTNIAAAPAANSWVLIFMGIVLALATVVALRKKAVNH